MGVGCGVRRRPRLSARRAPLFRWRLSLLWSSQRQQLNRGVVQTALELAFPQEEAERQVEIAIQWGRYGEVLAHDDAEETFYLEPAETKSVTV
ncbi:AAA-associated domain-containing protein [Roseiflexus castenholzii]|uniref:AAA-associated domain-containing protein n=1 Tax=Roseiflexus castenholzii TaxID=120962 RepID=UPI000A07256C